MALLRYNVNHISITSFPEINAANTRKMLKRLDLYSTQKYHDLQILYFFVKHNGDYVEAALELGCNHMTMYWRVRQLDKLFGGKLLSFIPASVKRQLRADATVSNAQIKAAAKTCTSVRAMARLLGINKTALIQRAKRWGIILPKGKKGRK